MDCRAGRAQAGHGTIVDNLAQGQEWSSLAGSEEHTCGGMMPLDFLRLHLTGVDGTSAMAKVL
jgi:hypothetical protein